MADLSIIFQHVSFTHNRATQPLFHDLTLHFTTGWTGIVGANGFERLGAYPMAHIGT